MSTVNLRDAKAGFSDLVDQAIQGEFVTITRHGKPVAALVSIEAAELAKRSMQKPERNLVEFLRSFPVQGFEVERNPTPGRDVEL